MSVLVGVDELIRVSEEEINVSTRHLIDDCIDERCVVEFSIWLEQRDE